METEGNRDRPILRDEKGLFQPGTAPGPGLTPETEEAKIIKKARKEIIEEYKETLAQALPQISPVLIAKALGGDISAIKELHDRVMNKPPQDVTSGGEKINPTPLLFNLHANNNSDTKDTQPQEAN